MTEKLRPLREPEVAPDGTLVAHSSTTPEHYDIRGAVTIGSTKVIPVIFVPGIMGSNLRVRRDVKLPENYPLAAGEPAWRPPNSSVGALWEARRWSKRDPGERQLILNPNFLEIDDRGELDVDACSLTRTVMRERGWGEIHSGSYGTLLYELQSHLDMTFRVNALGQSEIRDHWKEVMKCDPWRDWGARNEQPLTRAELEKYSQFQYPLYAVGYNWLLSCDVAAARLEKRIDEILKWWQTRKHQCNQVILVTHSMGGLVARACAKKIPTKIAGIVHGVMPALGAPVAYRRIACGTEISSPSNDGIDNYKAEKFADVAGKTTQETTPVMAASPGVLELLPNQSYPGPWLHVRVVRSVGGQRNAYDFVHLPDTAGPYDIYRETRAWYRLINPELVDPANLYSRRRGGVDKVISDAVAAAEKFHKTLENYYHPKTYAFYGADRTHLSYGRIRWTATEPSASTGVALTAGNILGARLVEQSDDGARTVEIEGQYRLRFEPEVQDAAGDDTVPSVSGAGPEQFAKQVFPTRGYGHQDSFKSYNMLLLTRHLIVKIVQGIK